MIGTVTFSPSGRFAFPRGYVGHLSLGMMTVSNPTRFLNLFDCDWTDGVFHSVFTFILKPVFYEGLTKGMTLDHVIDEAYGTTDPPGGFFPLDVHLEVVATEGAAGAEIRMTVPGFGTTPVIRWTLPLMDATYWQLSSERA